MGRGPGRPRKEDSAVFEADTSQLIKTEDDLKDLSDERKDQYLNRMKAEDDANKKHFKKVDEWLVVTGNKVLRKTKNATGSEYTFYWFNMNRNKDAKRKLLAQGFLEYGDPDSPETLRKIPLKTVDGVPFKPKSI